MINQYYPRAASQSSVQAYGWNGQSHVPAPQQMQQQPAQPARQSASAPGPANSASAAFYRTPDFYLIAFTNHTILAAVSFSVEGDTMGAWSCSRWVCLPCFRTGFPGLAIGRARCISVDDSQLRKLAPRSARLLGELPSR